MRKYSRKIMKKRRQTRKKRGGYTKEVKALFWPSKVKPGTVGHKVIVFNRYDDEKFNKFSTILGNYIRENVIDTEEGLMALSSQFRGKKIMDPEKVMVYGFDFKPGN
jgi:hypothetical protein